MTVRAKMRRDAQWLTAGCGILIAAGSLLPWVAGRGVRPQSGMTHTSVSGLFHWNYLVTAPVLRSFAAVVFVTGVLVVIGAAIGSRVMVLVFCFVALVAGGLWIGLNASHYSPISLPFTDLRIGAWLTLIAALVGLAAPFILRGSTREDL